MSLIGSFQAKPTKLYRLHENWKQLYPFSVKVEKRKIAHTSRACCWCLNPFYYVLHRKQNANVRLWDLVRAAKKQNYDRTKFIPRHNCGRQLNRKDLIVTVSFNIEAEIFYPSDGLLMRYGFTVLDMWTRKTVGNGWPKNSLLINEHSDKQNKCLRDICHEGLLNRISFTKILTVRVGFTWNL